MKSSRFFFMGVPLVAWACGPSGNASRGGPGDAGGGAELDASAGGNPGSGASPGDTGGGASSGSGDSGSASGEAGGVESGSTAGASAGGVAFDGGVDMIPAQYTGTPFATNTIPGFIYAANYDKGGPGVAFCHGGTAATPAACAAGIHLTDWCCSATGGSMTNARCDDRDQHLGPCPVYRSDADNAGLSHMNLGEVDTYAVAGPTWAAGLNGPTLTGPMVSVGTPVPQHASATTAEDTYLGYMATGEWSKYTVAVLAAGTYSIGGLMGVPAGTRITLDFGEGVTTGTIALPASPVTPACKCLEAYHAWTVVSDIGTVSFPAAGTYLMTLTLTAAQFNPLYFTFAKM
jgi:hypothetical protein